MYGYTKDHFQFLPPYKDFLCNVGYRNLTNRISRNGLILK